MTEPGDEVAAGAAGGGRLRASDADREQMIDVLKAAFVQARLTKEEFDARVGQAFVSRTYAELIAVIAGIPATPIGAQPLRDAVRAGTRHPVNPDLKGDVRVLVMAGPIAAVSWLAVVLVADNPAGVLLTLLAFVATVVALHSLLHGAMVLAEPRLQKRFGWQLSPPPPEPGEWLFAGYRVTAVRPS